MDAPLQRQLPRPPGDRSASSGRPHRRHRVPRPERHPGSRTRSRPGSGCSAHRRSRPAWYGRRRRGPGGQGLRSRPVAGPPECRQLPSPTGPRAWLSEGPGPKAPAIRRSAAASPRYLAVGRSPPPARWRQGPGALVEKLARGTGWTRTNHAAPLLTTSMAPVGGMIPVGPCLPVGGRRDHGAGGADAA